MSIIRTHGIVVGEVDTGEADKILTIFTKKHGKIQAAVKDAKRPKSNLMACSQFLVFSDFIFFKGKDLYRINSCEIVEPFYNIRNDIQKLTYATHAAEIIKEVVREELPSFRTLQLFLNTLFALSETEKSPDLIIRAFELRLMALIGYKPQVDACSECEESKVCTHFSFRKSGLVCSECGEKEGAISISSGAVRALRYIIKSDLRKLFSFEVNETVLKELKIISEIYLREKLEKEFKTLKFLEKI